MEEKRSGLSLKYKLLGLLTLIPVVSLGLYFFLATGEFKEDKMAYVHDSSAAVAKSLSTQVGAEINSFLETVRPMVSNYDQLERKFNDVAVGLFEQATRVDGLLVYRADATGQYRKIGTLTRTSSYVDSFTSDQQMVLRSLNKAANSELSISAPESLDKHLVISYRVGQKDQADHIVLVGLYRANELRKSFVESKLYKMFLIDSANRVLIGGEDGSAHLAVFEKVNKNKLPDGSIEVSDKEDKLAGFSEVGFAGLVVTSIVPKKEALKAVETLILKSITFFIGLISVTIIISLIASIQLTSALRDLYNATKQIAKGDFSIRVERKSNDEVGGLTDGFNFMAAEVSRLMEETADKARMQGELETVKVVQETLFPKDEAKIEDYKIIGHFEPASECGGDWWNYSRVGNHLYLWIGDATGHGAPAAMVTSAAKSAATIVEDLPNLSPGRAMEILNKAIHETSKGRILMTFFVASIDLTTGEVKYANASHEPPFVMRRKEGKFTKKDLEPLLDSNGPRLGDQKDATYNEGTTHLGVGDSIFFYTDGIVDLKNSEGKIWGERGFIRTLVNSVAQGDDLESQMNYLKQEIRNYRIDCELVDDVTLFMCQHEGAA